MVIKKYMISFSISVRQTTVLYDETLLHISAQDKKNMEQFLWSMFASRSFFFFLTRAVRISQLCRRKETEMCHQWPHCHKQSSDTALCKCFTELRGILSLARCPQPRSCYSHPLLGYYLKFSFVNKYRIITYDTHRALTGQAAAMECAESLHKEEMSRFNMTS